MLGTEQSGEYLSAPWAGAVKQAESERTHSVGGSQVSCAPAGSGVSTSWVLKCTESSGAFRASGFSMEAEREAAGSRRTHCAPRGG